MTASERRVGFVGSRGFVSCDTVAAQDVCRRAVARMAQKWDRGLVVVSGGAAGPDRWSVTEAKRLGVPYKEHLPDWKAHGKRAAFIRNAEIASDVDEPVAFWDGRSRGTADTIQHALDLHRPTYVWLKARGEAPRWTHDHVEISTLVKLALSRRNHSAK